MPPVQGQPQLQQMVCVYVARQPGEPHGAPNLPKERQLLEQQNSGRSQQLQA